MIKEYDYEIALGWYTQATIRITYEHVPGQAACYDNLWELGWPSIADEINIRKIEILNIYTPSKVTMEWLNNSNWKQYLEDIIWNKLDLKDETFRQELIDV